MGDDKFKILNAHAFDFGNPIHVHMTDTVMEWDVLTFVMNHMAANSIWQNVSDALKNGIMAPWSEFK